VTQVDAYAMGMAAWRLGAGRARKEDPVSAAAGVVLHRRPGDRVRTGDVLYELRSDDPARIPAAAEVAATAVTIGRPAPPVTPLVLDRLSAGPERTGARRGRTGGRRAQAGAR
jgi:thymidine phosphorylase